MNHGYFEHLAGLEGMMEFVDYYMGKVEEHEHHEAFVQISMHLEMAHDILNDMAHDKVIQKEDL